MSAAGGSSVRVALCGELRLEVNGRRHEQELPGRLGRVLLGYLTLNRGRAVTRDELVDALWPTGAPAEPSRTLSTLLSALRRCLGAERLAGRAQLRLALPPDAEVDVERALADADQARMALADGDLERAAARAEAAIAVLERELLPGFDAPWLEERRRELDEHVLSALELLARASLAAEGDALQRSQVASRRLVALAPYRESGYALLMEAQAARGNVAEALQTYERLRRLMREELGTTPSPRVREAHRRLLQRVDDGGPARLPLPLAVARLAERPFVGREDLIATLDRLLDDAARGERRFAFVAGEPGIGKSSLAATFARGAHAAGKALVLYGRTDEQRVLPLQPFVEMISHWAEHGRVDAAAEAYGDELEALGRLVPALRRRFPPDQPSRDASEAERFRMFTAIAAIIADEVGDGTFVAIFEDVHWADRSTHQLIRGLARVRALPRMLVIATYRDTEVASGTPLHDLIADLRREHVLERIPVRGLDRDETKRLIESRGLGRLGAGGAEALRRMTGGNPLFLDEMLGALADAAAEGMALDRALADLGVPEGVKEVVLRRVDRIVGPARDVLTLAAVAGTTFRPGVIEALPAVTTEQVDEVLDRAVSARLLIRGDGGAPLSFSHAVVREALYDSAGDQRRARLHHVVAQALEGRGEPAELARHYFAARHIVGPEPAIRYAREAAERAAESLAWEEAVVALERALEADELRDPADLKDRCELLLALGDARRRAGHGDARQTFRAAAEIARGRYPEQLARAAIDWASPYFQTAAVDEERNLLLREALAALPPGRGDLRSRLLTSLAESRQFAGRSKEAAQLSDEAVSLAERLGDDEVLVNALSGRHLSLMHAENLDERLSMGARLADLGRRTGDRERELRTLHPRLFDLLEHGDLAQAREARDRLEALAGELRQPLFAHFAVVWSCTFAQIDGRLDDAERFAFEAAEMRRSTDPAGAARVLAGQLYMVRYAQGRLGEQWQDVLQSRARYPSLSVWRAAAPLAQAAAGDAEGALADLEAQVAALDTLSHDLLWLGSAWLLAEAAVELQAADAAGPLYRALAPYADRWAQVGQGGNAGPMARALGLLAAVRGEAETATVHLDHAVRRSAEAGAAGFETQARADLAALAGPTRTSA